MSYQPKANEVGRLRRETGAGMMDCKRALAEADGDFTKARDLLRKWGMAGVQKRAERLAAEGLVDSYLHQTNPDLPPRIGVLVELNCETDFVAKSSDFRGLAREIAMHIAWADPRWVTMEDVPHEVLEGERSIIAESKEVAGKPPQVVEKIIDGKLRQVFAGPGGVLLEQALSRDAKKRVGDLVSDVAAKVKENVIVRRFARFKVGEDE